MQPLRCEPIAATAVTLLYLHGRGCQDVVAVIVAAAADTVLKRTGFTRGVT